MAVHCEPPWTGVYHRVLAWFVDGMPNVNVNSRDHGR